MNGPPDGCPVLAGILAAGGEVHLPEGRTPAGSTIARFAGQVGLTAALAFVPPAGAAVAEPLPIVGSIARSPVPGMPVLSMPDVAALAAEDGPRRPVGPVETWSLRGSIADDRIELKGSGGKVRVRRDLAQHVVDAAIETGVDPDVMMAMADKESGFDPQAKAGTSSAVGLYQFVELTWLEMVRRAGPRHGLAVEAAAIALADGRPVVQDQAERRRILSLREDPRLASLMACELYKLQTAGLGQRIGSKPTAAEAYMAHMLGMNGASRFILANRERPGALAKSLFPKEAKSNKAIFHEGRRARTMAQVHQVVSRQIDMRLSFYENIAEKLLPSPSYGRR